MGTSLGTIFETFQERHPDATQKRWEEVALLLAIGRNPRRTYLDKERGVPVEVQYCTTLPRDLEINDEDATDLASLLELAASIAKSSSTPTTSALQLTQITRATWISTELTGLIAELEEIITDNDPDVNFSIQDAAEELAEYAHNVRMESNVARQDMTSVGEEDRLLEGLYDTDRSVRDLEEKLKHARSKRENLVQQAVESGITQYQIAKKLDRQPSTVHRWMQD